ncbi:hypothetical protein D3C85_714810 [compost metagenome]
MSKHVGQYRGSCEIALAILSLEQDNALTPEQGDVLVVATMEIQDDAVLEISLADTGYLVKFTSGKTTITVDP